MNDDVEISVRQVILEGITQKPTRCDKLYIVYRDPSNARHKIRVNTNYRWDGAKVRLCPYYDRGLCNTWEEFVALPMDEIESQAYGAWMDGAR